MQVGANSPSSRVPRIAYSMLPHITSLALGALRESFIASVRRDGQVFSRMTIIGDAEYRDRGMGPPSPEWKEPNLAYSPFYLRTGGRFLGSEAEVSSYEARMPDATRLPNDQLKGLAAGLEIPDLLLTAPERRSLGVGRY